MELKEVTSEVLKELLETLKDTKKFVLAQAPDIAKEIILEAKVQSLFGLAFSFILLCISVACGLQAFADKGFGWGLAAMLTLMLGGGFLVGCGAELISLITAPKKYILTTLINYTKKDKS